MSDIDDHDPKITIPIPKNGRSYIALIRAYTYEEKIRGQKFKFEREFQTPVFTDKILKQRTYKITADGLYEIGIGPTLRGHFRVSENGTKRETLTADEWAEEVGWL